MADKQRSRLIWWLMPVFLALPMIALVIAGMAIFGGEARELINVAVKLAVIP